MLEPRALDELLPDWRTQGAPVTTAATDDRRAPPINPNPEPHVHAQRLRSCRSPPPPPMTGRAPAQPYPKSHSRTLGAPVTTAYTNDRHGSSSTLPHAPLRRRLGRAGQLSAATDYRRG